MEARTGPRENRPEGIDERRRRRRQLERRRRREIRRRRLTALAVLAAVIAVVAAAGVGLLGGGDESPKAKLASGGTTPASRSKPESSSSPASRAEQPAPKLVRGYDAPVPILMYHVIAEAPPDAANPGLFVPPKELRRQVRWLARKGFTGVTLSQLDAAWNHKAKIPEKPIVLSFDDGTRDQHDAAAPILASRGWPGVLNLKLESVRQGELSEKMVKEMLADGWELASHTINHLDLTTLDPAALKREVAGSRRALARRFGVPVDFFCYPSGAYDEATIAAVEAAGYKGATTTNPGLAKAGDPYELARVRVEPGEGAAGLKASLQAAGVDVG